MPSHTPQPTMIHTRDGDCRSFLFKPEGVGPWPAVLVYMDALGIRPALLELGQHLADHGYVALIPDLFYRSGPYDAMDPHEVFSDPDGFKVIKKKFFVHMTVGNVMSDTTAFIAFLDQQSDVKPGPIGTTGYCMGGRMSLLAAGRWPKRVAAAASFHGSNLATDEADSPHLLASQMKARVYVAGATDDASFPDEMKQRLETALTEAHVEHTVETYPAKHGWVFRDTPTHDEACTKRHWQSLLALMDAKLGK